MAPFAISSAQEPTSSATVQTRTRAIAASFNKSKHVVKEKRGVRMEKYKRVESEPAVKASPHYSSAAQITSEYSSRLHAHYDRPWHNRH